MIAQLGLVLMGVADNIMVGHLGAAPLAAAGISNSVFFLIAVIGSGAISIISPMVAGSQMKHDAEDNPGNLLKAAFRIALIMGVLTMLVLGGVTYQFEMLRQDAEVNLLAVPYMVIITLSVLPMFYFWAGKQFTDGLGDTRVAMMITIIGLVANVFFNWILIYGNLGLPALGLNGAGIGTLLARILMAGLMYRSIFISDRYTRWMQNSRLVAALVQKILKLGIPSGMQYFFEVAAFSGAAVIAGWFGVAQLAAHQIAINLASVSYMAAAGISAAGAIRVGDAVGRRNGSDVVKAGTAALLLVVAFMSLAGLIFLLGKDLLVALYIDDPAVAEVASGLLLIAAVFQLSDGTQVTGLGILRGMYDVYIPTAITLIAYWIIGIPLGYWLGAYMDMGVAGIWYGLLAGLTCSAAMLLYRFFRLAKKM